MNDYEEGSNWPEGESYCVSNERGFTRFGCVREIEVRGGVVRVALAEGAVREWLSEPRDHRLAFCRVADGGDQPGGVVVVEAGDGLSPDEMERRVNDAGFGTVFWGWVPSAKDGGSTQGYPIARKA